jgi:geranylgeranyl diphosphate synthase type I
LGIEEYIAAYRETLNEFIIDRMTNLVRTHTGNGKEVAGLYATLREASLGAKHIRGSLVKLGYEIISPQKAGDSLLPVAAACEILQTALLCHDDIIDRSPLRRGKPSIWQKIASDYDDPHYGLSQATMLGDCALILANRLIAGSELDADKKISLLLKFQEMQLKTIDGEILDVFMGKTKSYRDRPAILNISRLKTAWYTIVGPLQLGALAAGAGADALEQMEKFGMSLGIAFQIRDDILGIQASERETGKSNTSDITEGKVTLLIHYALKNGTPRQIERIDKIYGAASISEEERLEISEIFRDSKAFEDSAKMAEEYLNDARQYVGKITTSPEKAEMLLQLSDLVFLRKR